MLYVVFKGYKLRVQNGKKELHGSTEIRYKNFKYLLNKLADANGGIMRGVLLELSIMCGIPDRQLSHIKTRRRNIGNSTARTIEAAFKLPIGWLDVAHDTTLPDDEAERKFVEVALSIYRQAPDKAQTAIINLMSETICKKYEMEPDN
jgi:hypothetical protein